MGKILIPGSSGGGVGSDDVTAGKAQVLQGYKTVTTDSNDEVVEGTIPDKGVGNINARPDVMDWGNSRMSIVMQEGYYHGNNGNPWVWATFADLQKLVKIAPNQVLETATYLGVKGGIKVVDTKANNYTANQAKLFGMDPGRGKLVMQLGHGNAYYHRDDGNPHVEVNASVLGTAGADSVLQWQTASSQSGINFQGTIPRWIATHGDVILANPSHSGQGFAYDLPNVGRCIVVGIKNGAFIQGANYVALPSPNFQPWNIRKNVNMNGMIGTMEDYGAGRVPFRNATFDNVLISGVASMGLGKNLQNYSKPSTSITDGIIRFPHNGIGLHKYYDYGVLEESITLAHSIDLTPFKLIRLGLKFPYGGRWGAQRGAADLVAIAMMLGTQYNPEYNPSRNAKIHHNVFAKTGFSRIIPQMGVGNSMAQIPAGAMYFVDIDVSNIQGQHRIVLGFGTNNPNGDVVTSQVNVLANNDSIGIGHIEFIN